MHITKDHFKKNTWSNIFPIVMTNIKDLVWTVNKYQIWSWTKLHQLFPLKQVAACLSWVNFSVTFPPITMSWEHKQPNLSLSWKWEWSPCLCRLCRRFHAKGCALFQVVLGPSDRSCFWMKLCACIWLFS